MAQYCYVPQCDESVNVCLVELGLLWRPYFRMAGVFDIDLETEDISDTEVGSPQSFVRSQLTNELLKQFLVWTRRDCVSVSD